MDTNHSENRNSFFFLDETGLLNKPSDRFFMLGTVITSQPEDLYLTIQQFRDQTGYYDELKWNSLSRKNLPAAKNIFKTYLNDSHSRFAYVVLDRALRSNSGKLDIWQIYQETTIRLVTYSLLDEEKAIILADYLPSPKDNKFERQVREQLNRNSKREAALNVCRLDSRSTDLLQLTDLLLGSVSYEYKLTNGLIERPGKVKTGMLEFIKQGWEVDKLKATDHGPSGQFQSLQVYYKTLP